MLKSEVSSSLSVHGAPEEGLEEKSGSSVAVDLLEDPVHEGKFGKDGLRIQVALRVEPRGIRMSEFIRTLIEVSLHVARGQLCPPLV